MVENEYKKCVRLWWLFDIVSGIKLSTPYLASHHFPSLLCQYFFSFTGEAPGFFSDDAVAFSAEGAYEHLPPPGLRVYTRHCSVLP